MVKKNRVMPIADLRAALDYNAETGVFLWRTRVDVPKEWNTRHAGKKAGHSQLFSGGYRYTVIRVNGVLFVASRLAWAYFHGHWPDVEVDHRDRDGEHNWISNLRLASHVLNSFNRSAQKNSKTGIKGIGRHGDQWRARIRAHGRDYTACFPTKEDAIAWRLKMAEGLHGEFSGDIA